MKKEKVKMHDKNLQLGRGRRRLDTSIPQLVGSTTSKNKQQDMTEVMDSRLLYMVIVVVKMSESNAVQS